MIDNSRLFDALINQPRTGRESRWWTRIPAPVHHRSPQVEETQRARDQKALSARGMTQKVIVNNVKAVGDAAQVEADRLISVGPIRSAFPFPLALVLNTTPRSEGNPYGLLLLSVKQPKTEGSK